MSKPVQTLDELLDRYDEYRERVDNERQFPESETREDIIAAILARQDTIVEQVIGIPEIIEDEDDIALMPIQAQVHAEYENDYKIARNNLRAEQHKRYEEVR